MADDSINRAPWPTSVEVPLGIQLQGPDFDVDVQMLIGLGAVVRAASQLELGLRMLFCALDGSKYAAVTAAGQDASWLLERSESILKCRTEVPDEDRSRLAALLGMAKSAIRERNRFVHDVWAGDAPGKPGLMRSQRGRFDLSFNEVTLEGLIQTAQTLIECHIGLTEWIAEALGPDSISVEAQLRWEEYVRSLTPEEREALIERRSPG
jgi:hypothetical protein